MGRGTSCGGLGGELFAFPEQLSCQNFFDNCLRSLESKGGSLESKLIE